MLTVLLGSGCGTGRGSSPAGSATGSSESGPALTSGETGDIATTQAQGSTTDLPGGESSSSSTSSGDTATEPGATDDGCVDGSAFGTGVVCNADGTACSRVVRVMSYNVHALPELLSGENPRDRMVRIGEILAERRDAGTQPDLCLLQEAFDKADRIIDRAGYSQVVEGPVQMLGLGSGLYALSDHGVLATDRMSFEACAGVDCGSSKGVVAVESQLADMPHPIVVLTTHLQAQSENDAVRIEQIDELLPFLEAQGIADVASVFAGDFNFKAKPDHDAHPSYAHFVANTPYLASGEICLADVDTCEVVLEDPVQTDENDLWFSTNDHQFHLAPANAPYEIEVQRAAVTFTEPLDGAPLSDHFAREFDYCFTWVP